MVVVVVMIVLETVSGVGGSWRVICDAVWVGL